MAVRAKSKTATASAARSRTREHNDPGSRAYAARGRSYSGVYVDHQTALRFTAVWRAINLLSFGAAMASWDLVQKNGSAHEIVVDDDVSYALGWQFAPDMPAMHGLAAATAHQLATGNGYIEIVRKAYSNKPRYLHVIVPDRVTPRRRRDSGGELYYECRNDDGSIVEIPPEDMIHLRGLAYDGLVGYSPLSLFKNSIGLSLAAEQYGASFYGNGAAPSGVVSTEKDIPAEKLAKMEERFNKAYTGSESAGAVVFLEDGLKWANVSLPQDAAQFIETRKFGVSDVSRMYGVPAHMLGELDRATFNSTEQLFYEFVMLGLSPITSTHQQEFSIKLIGEDGIRGGRCIRANMERLLTADMRTRGEFIERLARTGVFDINEIREFIGRNPVEHGDLRLVPMNMVPVEDAREAWKSDTSSKQKAVDKGGPSNAVETGKENAR